MLPTLARDREAQLPTTQARARSWPLLSAALLVALYAVAAALLLASKPREFADETDNLLGGLLLARGVPLYSDFFSSHMPLPYFLAALPALLGATTLEHFRLFTNLLLLAATLSIAISARNQKAVWLWAVITVFAHTLQWGEMLTASTTAGYGVFLVGLLFFTSKDLRFTPRQIALLSAATFIAVQSELIAVYQLTLLAICFVATNWRNPRYLAVTALAVAAPHVLLIGAFAAVGILSDFVYYAYAFNQAYYSVYVMNPTVVGMLHDWEAQYRTYLALSLANPLSIHGTLVIANLAASVLLWRTRGLVFAVVYYLFIALCHVRDEGAYYLCSYFSLALLVTWAAQAVGIRRLAPLAVATFALAAAFTVQIARTYDFSVGPRVASADVEVARALLQPDEPLFLLPFDPYVYLASGHMPASRFSYYLPWHTADPRIDRDLRADLARTRPPVVIFRRDELVNGQWLPREYARDLYDFLTSQGYAPVDPSSAFLGDILVRSDRLASARQTLSSRTFGPTDAAHRPRP